MSRQAILKEYEAFQGLTDALQRASDYAKQLGDVRSDQKYEWHKMAETYLVAREAVFRLAGDGTSGTN